MVNTGSCGRLATNLRARCWRPLIRDRQKSVPATQVASAGEFAASALPKDYDADDEENDSAPSSPGP